MSTPDPKPTPASTSLPYPTRWKRGDEIVDHKGVTWRRGRRLWRMDIPFLFRLFALAMDDQTMVSYLIGIHPNGRVSHLEGGAR